MSFFDQNQRLQLGMDVEIKGDLEEVNIKCPNCKRWKTLEFFLNNTCECDNNLSFEVELEEIVDEEEEPEGLF